MDLNLDAEQLEFVATARRFLAQRFPLSEQAGSTDQYADPADVGRQVAELGWTGLGVPSELGGVDGTLVELTLLAEELGRAGVSASLTASIPLVAGVLAQAHDPRHAALLQAVCEGTTVATMPLLSDGVADEWSTRPAPGLRTVDGWALSGSFTLVLFGTQADVFVVDADLEGRGRALVLVAAEHADVRTQEVIGGAPRAAVSFAGAPVIEADVLDLGAESVPGVMARARAAATILECAQTVGACEAALGLAVTWATDRVQFDRPIGSFQTVANRCADMRVTIDAARLLTWEAAWALANDRPDADLLVSVAKAYLGDVTDMIVFNAHQVHGAMGYSTEYPLHVFTRRIKAFRVSFGSGDDHLQRVAEQLGL